MPRELRRGPSGPDAALTSDDVINTSLIGGATLTEALDDIYLRRITYLDQVDGPVGLWNFNDTINAVVGPNFSVTTGTELAFSDMIPGFRCLELGTPARLSCPVTPSLQLGGDLSIEAIILYDSSPTNHILLSMGGAGATAADNKLYEVFFPTPNYPRRWQFNWESGVAVARNFQTPSTALSPSLPPIHNIISIGWSRGGNILTPYLSGRRFSAPSAVQIAPAGGTNGFLTLGGDATADNNTSFLIASLAIYNYERTPTQWAQSYNRSLGDFWGPIVL